MDSARIGQWYFASSAVAVLDLNKHTTRVLFQNGARPRYVFTGHLIYYRSGALFAAPFNAARLEIVGPETSVVEGVSDNTNGSYAVSDNGLLVYLSRAGKSALAWAGRKGATEAIGEPTEWGSGRLSPDGSRIVMSVYTGDNQDIWIYDRMGHSSTRLTFDGQNSWPIWSPDGRRITFIGTQRDNRGIYRVAADGAGKPELVLATLKRAFPHSWSPDGKTLVYSEAGPSGYTVLWALTIPGGKPTQLHEGATGEGFAELSRWALAGICYLRGG